MFSKRVTTLIIPLVSIVGVLSQEAMFLKDPVLESEQLVEDFYKYISYQDMRTKLYDLANLYPTLMKIQTAE